MVEIIYTVIATMFSLLSLIAVIEAFVPDKSDGMDMKRLKIRTAMSLSVLVLSVVKILFEVALNEDSNIIIVTATCMVLWTITAVGSVKSLRRAEDIQRQKEMLHIMEAIFDEGFQAIMREFNYQKDDIIEVDCQEVSKEEDLNTDIPMIESKD